jgi:hypothetical protein
VNLPLIDRPLTTSELRARVLAQLALLNGKAPKPKARAGLDD